MRVELNYSPRLTPAEQKLLALPSRLKNLRPLMQRGIAPAANRMQKQWWDSKGTAFGRAGWAPLAASTIKAKKRKGTFDKGILRDTDHLFKAIFRERVSDSRLRVVAGGLRLSLNTGIPYAIYHQVGTQFMPERQVIPYPFPRPFIREVREIVRDYLATGVVRDND